MSDCAFNNGIECPKKGRLCEVCGWNPKEEHRRILKAREEYGEPTSLESLIHAWNVQAIHLAVSGQKHANALSQLTRTHVQELTEVLFNDN